MVALFLARLFSVAIPPKFPGWNQYYYFLLLMWLSYISLMY